MSQDLEKIEADFFKQYFRFNLYYYSNGGAAKEKRDTILLIDTRMDRIAGTKVIQDNDDLDQLEENPVEKAIQEIRFNINLR